MNETINELQKGTQEKEGEGYAEKVTLPGHNCGACGFRTCLEFENLLQKKPEQIKRCIYLDKQNLQGTEQESHVLKPAQQDRKEQNQDVRKPAYEESGCSCGNCEHAFSENNWKDSLGRKFDFVLDLFPGDPGPRETIKLHNPALVRELEIQKGDILIGRPLGMSCGCPITHCGIAMEVDYRTGILVWCVTGPLMPRANGYKDLGYYSAEAYEGMVRETNTELKVGMRYWFMPHKCMLQWRHSGLVNFISKNSAGLQVRLEGLFIG